MTESEVEVLTEFVRRYCAIESSEEPQKGRFTFQQGKTRAKATKARAPVAIGEFERTAEVVLRRVRELTSNGEGHVWVAVYHEGDTAPLESKRFQGTIEDEDEDDERRDNGDAVGRLTSALVKTNTQLLSRTNDLERRLDAQHANELVQTEQFTLMHVYSQIAEHGANAAQTKAALEALAPTLERVAPALLAWLSGGAAAPTGAADLPTDPAERLSEGVRRMIILAAQVGQVATQHPELVTEERVGALRQLVRDLAPRLGIALAETDGGEA
jgi:hypothetical protein